MSINLEIETPNSFSFLAPRYRNLNNETFSQGDSFFGSATSSATRRLTLLTPSKDYAKFIIEKLTTKSPLKEPKRIKFLDNLGVKADADEKNELPVVNFLEKAVNEVIIKPTNIDKQIKKYLGRKSQGIRKRQKPIERFSTRKSSDARKSPIISFTERIRQFIEKTPDKLKPKLVTMKPTSNYVNLPTKTKSPFLRTKLRAERTRLKKKGNEINNDKIKSKPVDINSGRVKKTEPFKFKAQPLPSGLHGGLLPLPTTATKPFKLRTDIRGEKYQQSLREKITKEDLPFRARPAPNVVPYRPKKSDRPITKTVEFKLHSDERLEKRKVYDKQRNLREQEEKIRKQKEDEERNKREIREIRQLRAELVHRAQPIKRYAPVKIEFNRKVTKPVSPLIGEKRRIKLQALNEPNTMSENVSTAKIVPQSKNNNRKLKKKGKENNN
ncbi:hypothetical protein C1646_740126 [Rhizophagus diaphanus]|nr:hypothetical protein C1646_740126 [Rhizophagus diaphanus] [Rhizophagus sp. MUCL 43196]